MNPLVIGSVNVGGTVVGVLFALCLVIVVATLAAVYILWKDGCCKKREEETEEDRRPRRAGTTQNSSLLNYLARFTNSGNYRNNVTSTPPSEVVSAKRPSINRDVDEDEEKSQSDDGLQSDYNRMVTPPATQAAVYEDVWPRQLAAPQTGGTDDGFEYSGRYDYVQSDSVRYELSVDGGAQVPSNSQLVAGHYETSQSFQVTPPSQHYAVSYATPSITQSKREMEATAGGGEAIYQEPAKDRRSLYAQFKDFKIKLIPRESISITGFLGSGEFGKVQKGEWLSGGRRGGSLTVAVKSLKENLDEDSKVKFLQEVAIMGQFSHPNVVKLHGLVSTDEPLMMVIELLSRGDLRNHLISLRNEAIKKSDNDIPSTLLSYCRDIGRGMSYLASKAFVHRDLAARNILISEDFICKVADFGMSRELAEADYYVSQGGQIPVKWTAPDALHYRKYSTASDVWSFGCVMYEIWSLGHKPFESYSNLQAVKMVDKGQRLAPPPGCPRAVYSVMMDCWHPDASERPTFMQICQVLKQPDSVLLKWSVRDRVDASTAIKVGEDLKLGYKLHKDLQGLYQTQS